MSVIYVKFLNDKVKPLITFLNLVEELKVVFPHHPCIISQYKHDLSAMADAALVLQCLLC